MNTRMPRCVYTANGSYMCEYAKKKHTIEKMSNQDNTASEESNQSNSNSSNTNLTGSNAQYMSELNTYNKNYAEWMEKKNNYMNTLTSHNISRLDCTTDTGDAACHILDNDLVMDNIGPQCCISKDEQGVCKQTGNLPVCKWSSKFVDNSMTEWGYNRSNIEPIKPKNPYI